VARWAQQTCGGVASVQRLAGNVGYLDLTPILFPAIIGGELITAAMSLVAAAVNPVSGTSWEGTGVTPDIHTPAAQARDKAHRLALEQVAAADGPQAAEARSALAAPAA
jgi:hypothetical protein